MRITVVPARSLSPEHVKRWAELQEVDSALSSPFLSPDFTLAVAAVRPDVEVGVLEQGGTVVGVFPFQRGRFLLGQPVGGRLNDVQGVIIQRDTEWDAVRLLRGCGLAAWEFTRLLASQTPFEPFHYHRRVSAVVDVSRGYDAYVAETREALRPLGLARKVRKLESEIGPLRFEPHSLDIRLVHTLMRWKLDRYGRHSYFDVYAIPWVRSLLERIHATQTPRFAGVLSVLYAGNDVAAVHMGMRSPQMWHHWFHAYNPAIAEYSPGLLLLLKMAEHASAVGMRGIDLGGSDEYPYKQGLMNSAVELLEGTVGRLPVITSAQRRRHFTATWIRQSPLLHRPARTLLRAYRRLRHGLLYEHVDHDGGHRHRTPAAQD